MHSQGHSTIYQNAQICKIMTVIEIACTMNLENKSQLQ